MRPPRVATWLMSRSLPQRELDWILGDLKEVFGAKIAEGGGMGARLWYWRQAVSFSARFLRERWKNHRIVALREE